MPHNQVQIIVSVRSLPWFQFADLQVSWCTLLEAGVSITSKRLDHLVGAMLFLASHTFLRNVSTKFVRKLKDLVQLKYAASGSMNRLICLEAISSQTVEAHS